MEDVLHRADYNYILTLAKGIAKLNMTSTPRDWSAIGLGIKDYCISPFDILNVEGSNVFKA